MDNFLFYSPTEFRFGRGAENEAGECVVNCGARRAVIVYGGAKRCARPCGAIAEKSGR